MSAENGWARISYEKGYQAGLAAGEARIAEAVAEKRARALLAVERYALAEWRLEKAKETLKGARDAIRMLPVDGRGWVQEVRQWGREIDAVLTLLTTPGASGKGEK